MSLSLTSYSNAIHKIWDNADLITKQGCVLCNSKLSKAVITRMDGLMINECLECGLAYVNPRPSSKQLCDYYSAGYFRGEKDFFKGQDYCAEREKAVHNESVTGYKAIESNFDLKNKTVLDIGCASGSLLYLLKKKGARELVGIDSAEYPISYGLANYGLDLRCTTLETANLPSSHFDLVTMIDVLEHIENVDSFLAEVRRILKTTGHLYISTPNYSAYTLAHDKWICLHQDFEHLQYFSLQSMNEVCRLSGFALVKWWTDAHPFKTPSYSNLYKYGLHRLLHPHVAVKNMNSRLRFLVNQSKRSDLGLNLYTILAVN